MQTFNKSANSSNYVLFPFIGLAHDRYGGLQIWEDKYYRIPLS